MTDTKPTGITLSPDQAMAEVIAATHIAFRDINLFADKVFKTRGGRMGSGMGVLLEALWAYYVDKGRPAREVGNEGWEIAWLPDNEYNDFACVQVDQPWEPASRTGEFFRIEAKSMNSGADESKAHFDQLHDQLGERDLLLAIIWTWQPIDRLRVRPVITDYFIGRARPVAAFRDKLHIARGGSFVDRETCADKCSAATCTHHGEPLNASGKRERISGPKSLRPSATSSFAANFGGLMRMLKTSSPAARKIFVDERASDDDAHKFISFMHRNFPKEEENIYPPDSWKELADRLGINTVGLSREDVRKQVRAVSKYMDTLRQLHR